MQELYFKNAFVSLYYDKDQKLGTAVWNGNIKGSEFRESLLLCLDLIDRFGLISWLADDRKMKAIDPADVLWSQEVFLPRILRGSIVRMARLPSHSAENREAIELLKDSSKGFTTNLIIRDFNTEAEAIECLLQV
ncbi:hypothetical protein [Pontibacter cellulosilyticus]|uniref:Uncharacterized protein n=1 Tax=Pontibacter cellulosilyticus TaxID=1720253 RepID=A0A923N702_9BACT|nr:hypothetical protein [Pontibacter cellulosilyticus]MBC5994050.1 hypothetical protein [Pontibacter cellulosilyticus]